MRKLVSTFCRREHNSLATEYYKLITEVNYRAKAEIQPEKWEDIEFHRSMECGPYEKRCDEPRYRIYGSKIERQVRENLDGYKNLFERHPDLNERFLKLLDSSGVR